ncbi:hypothetical protein DFJ73DRAFT_465342 [Zopfochytrium polystomum]|nr:hypothetical protein DFJ73DRAFT_465342 [Zopfochytrium polystomum]
MSSSAGATPPPKHQQHQQQQHQQQPTAARMARSRSLSSSSLSSPRPSFGAVSSSSAARRRSPSSRTPDAAAGTVPAQHHHHHHQSDNRSSSSMSASKKSRPKPPALQSLHLHSGSKRHGPLSWFIRGKPSNSSLSGATDEDDDDDDDIDEDGNAFSMASDLVDDAPALPDSDVRRALLLQYAMHVGIFAQQGSDPLQLTSGESEALASLPPRPLHDLSPPLNWPQHPLRTMPSHSPSFASSFGSPASPPLSPVLLEHAPISSRHNISSSSLNEMTASPLLNRRSQLGVSPLPPGGWTSPHIVGKPKLDPNQSLGQPTPHSEGPFSAPLPSEGLPYEKYGDAQRDSLSSTGSSSGTTASNTSEAEYFAVAPHAIRRTPSLRRTKTRSDLNIGADKAGHQPKDDPKGANANVAGVLNDQNLVAEDEDDEVTPITGIISTVWRRPPSPTLVASIMSSDTPPLSPKEQQKLIQCQTLARLDGLHRTSSPAIPPKNFCAPCKLSSELPKVILAFEGADADGLPVDEAAAEAEKRLLKRQQEQARERLERANAAVGMPSPKLSTSLPAQSTAPAHPPPPRRKSIQWADHVPNGSLEVFHDHAHYLEIIDRIREERLGRLVAARMREEKKRFETWMTSPYVFG